MIWEGLKKRPSEIQEAELPSCSAANKTQRGPALLVVLTRQPALHTEM